MSTRPAWDELGTLLRHELRMVLRDRRTIGITVVAPIIIFPLYIFIFNFVESREERALDEATYTYAVAGSRATWAAGLVEAAVALEAVDPDTTGTSWVERHPPGDPEEALEAGDLHAVVQGWTAAEVQADQGARAAAQEAGGGGESAEDDPGPAVPGVRVLYRNASDSSRDAGTRLVERLREVRAEQRDAAYRAAGFSVPLDRVARVETENVATAARETGAFLGVVFTPFLVMLMLMGGSIVAVDAISGEKERGTLETLLTTAASRSQIVWAKLLAVITVGLGVVVINTANMAIYLVAGVVDLPVNFALQLRVGDLVLLLLLFVPVTVLVAGALLLVSGVSKSYKEFGLYAFPLMLSFLLPGFAAALPGVELRSVISLVPLAGVAVATREILIGELDLLFISVAFVSTSGVAVWLTRLTQRTLSNERLIAGSELDAADLAGGPALFPRHVVLWFLVLWVVFFLVSLWFGQPLGLRGGIVVNLVGIFFGGSLLMVRRYRLNLVEAFGLRMPHSSAWFAVLVGAPSALVLVAGLSQIVNTYVFPVPEQMLEQLAQGLIPPDLPLWQIVFFVAVMPAVFEELVFRGVLVHGLRQRISGRWVLALSVGLMFGFFHVDLFRIVPTAVLGVVLTWVVLLCGSIYPAMLWHGLHNAISIVPAALEWLPEDFVLSSWWAAPAALGLAVSMWLLRASGTGLSVRSGP